MPTHAPHMPVLLGMPGTDVVFSTKNKLVSSMLAFDIAYARVAIVTSGRELLNEIEARNRTEGRPYLVRLAVDPYKTAVGRLKLGLAGSDGSRAGRAAAKKYVAESYFNAGHYGEVSHRLEELALEAGVPIVCSAYVREVLNKNVEPASDGIHYRRSIKGVGDVTKVLIGLPIGIPVTSSSHPQCPIPERVSHSLRRLAAHRRRRLAMDRSNDAVFSHALSIVKL